MPCVNLAPRLNALRYLLISLILIYINWHWIRLQGNKICFDIAQLWSTFKLFFFFPLHAEFQKLLFEFQRMHDRTILGTILLAIFINICILYVITWKILLIKITTSVSKNWGTHFSFWKAVWTCTSFQWIPGFKVSNGFANEA